MRAAVDLSPDSLIALFGESPFRINYVEVMDPDLGLLNQPNGIAVTPAGWLLLFLVGLQQAFAPWGWRLYTKRLREDEQAWLDLGKSPEQAVTNAYNNQRPPKKARSRDGGEKPDAAATKAIAEDRDQ